MKQKNKITIGDLKELLSKYNDNEQVILSTGFYADGKEVWIETEQFSLIHDGRDIVYIEGNEAQ